MSDFAALSSTANYLTLLAAISGRDIDLAKGLDPAYTSVTSPPTNGVRYNSANKRWETYNGSSWVELITASSDAFNMTVTGLRGGNLYGTVTNNGTISGGAIDVTTLKRGGSDVWTAASLTNLNQLTNGPAFITASALSPYAPLAGPALTGVPTAPTAAVDTSTTQLATTQYVVNQGYLKTSAAAAAYAPLTGAGTSGTWAINISGLAATASGSNALRQSDGTTWVNASSGIAASGGRGVNLAPNTYQYGLFSEFKNASLFSAAGNYAGLLTYAPYIGTSASTGDPSYQLLFSPAGASSTSAPTLQLRAGIDATWGAWSTILHSSNYNSYAPTLTGTGASGTWGINVSGSAGSVAWGNVSGLPAITGLTADTAATANTVARRDASGYLFAAYLNQSSGNNENPTISQIMVTNGGDGYLRKASLSALGAAITAAKASTLSQGGGGGTAMTFTYSGNSGQPTWLWGTTDGTNIQVWNPSNFNVNSATTAGATTLGSSRTDSTPYPVLWAPDGGSSQLYSCDGVTIQSSTATLSAAILTATTSISCGNSISANGSMTATTGLLYGRGGGLGLGRISTTTTTGSPAGTSAGDLVLVY
jgi:hypothetical protein